MNELQTITGGLVECDKDQVPFQMITIFKSITPQFYRNMSEREIKAEITSIQLLTQGIDNNTLAEMCQRAVGNYARERSENSKTYFDMNYVLKFYKEAFNYVHCDSIKISPNSRKISQCYNDATHTLWQKWRLNNGKIVEIGHIQERSTNEGGHDYSPKDYEMMTTSIDDLKDIEI